MYVQVFVAAIFSNSFKVVLLDDRGVGKTTFLMHATGIEPVFAQNQLMTVGVEFFTRIQDFAGTKVKLQIWKLTNEDRFKSLLPTYCLGAQGGLFLYDVTNPQSWQFVDRAIGILRRQCGQIPVVAVGTKIDLLNVRKINEEEFVSWTRKYDIAATLEVSSENADNVEKVFQILTQFMMEKEQKL